jgi:hypothetical protein
MDVKWKWPQGRSCDLMLKKDEILSLDSCSPTHRAMKLRDGWGTGPLYCKKQLGS